MEARLKAEVRQRAACRCEYCHFPDHYAELPFQVDHIISQQHGGPTVLENLAWSCLRCNKYKGPNLSGVDCKVNQVVRLFNPREHIWKEHFTWDGPSLLGSSSTGRATVVVLRCNHPDALLVRVALMEEGIYSY
jgi:hypothetical protein